MVDKVLRTNWRKFDEYFQVLASFAQIGHTEAKFLIVEQNGIIRLLEFTMNCSDPFYSTYKIRMGDKMQEPNFTQAVDVISLLIRSCLTEGINQLKQASPESNHQNLEYLTEPKIEMSLGNFPLLKSSCFTNDLLIKAFPNNDSLQRMVIHLCWGHLEVSEFFIEEIVGSIRNRRSTKDIQSHLKILRSLLTMNDIDEYQQARANMALKFQQD